VLPASLHENDSTAAVLDELIRHDQAGRLHLVLVDRGVTAPAAARLSRTCGLEVRRVGHAEKPGTFVPLPLAWRVVDCCRSIDDVDLVDAWRELEYRKHIALGHALEKRLGS
jgi:hypothetical protein